VYIVVRNKLIYIFSKFRSNISTEVSELLLASLRRTFRACYILSRTYCFNIVTAQVAGAYPGISFWGKVDIREADKRVAEGHERGEREGGDFFGFFFYFEMVHFCAKVINAACTSSLIFGRLERKD